MKILNLAIANVGVTGPLLFLDDAEADEAFATIKAAMDKYKPYSNDDGETVTVKSSGGTATFRVGHLLGAQVEIASVTEATSIEIGRMNKRVKEAVLGPSPAAVSTT